MESETGPKFEEEPPKSLFKVFLEQSVAMDQHILEKLERHEKVLGSHMETIAKHDMRIEMLEARVKALEDFCEGLAGRVL